ncbi:hypothetical protein BGZ80_006009 [Entomortierella chlamydospora]|uniref:Superoxide dismutase copper/zinc binding domain-containing protein n=1 Tax=Entomortierella chlamydospora TaxID=101097 RepID=A0A9P6STQ5_9FUNG|nr:hypothetical protein BGZ79_004175 [Entomortierella chlamydospora]KAG0002199.1 hypothetical protein BGZ80_006009 [Entomortierella chlamydospora]
MHFKTIATALAVAGVAAAQNYTQGSAHINMNNIDATVTFAKVDTGVNVTVAVSKGLTEAFQILPVGFEYHVHVNPVGANNNCTSTGGHLDPANVGAAPCDPKNLTSCQVGDLSGKHGDLVAVNNSTGAIPTFSYIDTQLAFSGAASLVGRSVVIHNNGTRVACADIVVEGYSGNSSSTNGTTTTGGSTTSGAAKLVGSVALSGLVAAMMLVF